jgi:hypothetical protein
MKLVFEAEGVKRELKGPFRICASNTDLTALRDQINRILAEDFHYGWNTIWPSPEGAGPNTPPLPWR